MKITRWQLSGALALLLAACQQQRPAPAPDNGAAPTPQAKAQASPPASNAASLPEPLTIDPEPSPGDEPTIVARETISVNGKPASAGNGVHIAFDAGGRRKVDEFHRVALLHGGSDAGAPGLRPEYDPNYYGAFVLDPDGNKIEAVTHHGK